MINEANQEAELPLLDQLVLRYDTDQKTARRVQSAFNRVWKRLPPKVKSVLFSCWKAKSTVIIPGVPDEVIETRTISLPKAPYLAVSKCLPSTNMLSFDCSGSCALLWHGGVIPMMDALTLDVFIAENIISAYIRGKGQSPTRDSISKLLKKQIQVDYTVLQAWSKTFRKGISNLLDQQHPTRIVTPAIVLMIKNGHRFTDRLDTEEDTDQMTENGLAEVQTDTREDSVTDVDVALIYDPLATESCPDDGVPHEITRLLDQYEETPEDERSVPNFEQRVKSQKKR
jgi:hypothetical protein